MIRLKGLCWLVVVLTAVLLTVGCGDEEAMEGETAVSPPTITDISDFQIDPAQFSSFIMESEFSLTDSETGDLLQIDKMERRYRNDPQAEQLIMTQSQPGAAAHGGDNSSNLEMVTIEGVTYSVGHQSGCMAMPGNDLDTAVQLEVLDVTALLDNIDKAERALPNETIHGIETKHYTFDEAVYAPESSDGEVDVEGHFYLDATDNHLVRLVIEGIDPQLSLEEGISAGDHFRLEYNIHDVNQPIDIILPKACEDDHLANAEPAYPVMDDARDTFTYEGMLAYKADYPAEQILDFYQTELGTLGWQYDPDNSVPGEGGNIWMFNKEDGTIQIMVGHKDGEASVTISSATASNHADTTTDETAEAEPLPRATDAFDVLSLTDIEIYRSHAGVDDVIAFYESELTSLGWVYEPAAAVVDDAGTAVFFRKEQEALQILLASEGEETLVTVQRMYE